MNRILADAVVALNKLAAFIIIVASLILGYGMGVGFGPGGPIAGLLIGGLVGILVAGLFCGIVALLALIESHLRTLADRTRIPAQIAPASGKRPAPTSI